MTNLEIFFWIGYGILFIFLTMFYAWSIVNEDKFEKELDPFSPLIMIPIISFASWFLIVVILLIFIFEHIKDSEGIL